MPWRSRRAGIAWKGGAGGERSKRVGLSPWGWHGWGKCADQFAYGGLFMAFVQRGILLMGGRFALEVLATAVRFGCSI
ncbi:hypothetical protein MCW_01300 [Cardidatus Bartonella washoeensis 085-0475]|uniref:Uncharacterized protein n=1 Tax=Cardidatus Bartonella washoeensis 085-0475 TaxID=1094564 RepID=J0QED4_9HYPH|nr:hypothetical protein MCW_01300 [Bartonella washoeensis 085-0475]